MNYNYVKVLIKGRNINNYLKWLIKQNLEISKIKVVSYNELILILDYKDYNKLFKYSKTYNISIIEKYGKLKLWDSIKNNGIILISVFLGVIFIYFLSNIIFSVDIVYNNKEISDMLKNELRKYDIDKFKFKKKYSYIDFVKKKILEDKKDYLEWLEIEESGTKYIVKLVERKKDSVNNDYKYQSIVSSKNAIIKDIKAFSGEKNKHINEYVKENEVVISGILNKSNGELIYTKAKGNVYGEVWYKVGVEYPLYYKEEKVTGKSKNVLSIVFLSKKIPLFTNNKFKKFKSNEKFVVYNNLLPIGLIQDKMYEVDVIEKIYTLDEAIKNAIDLVKNKMQNSNNNILEFNNINVIDKEIFNSKIKLELFVSVIENITKIEEINEVDIE